MIRTTAILPAALLVFLPFAMAAPQDEPKDEPGDEPKVEVQEKGVMIIGGPDGGTVMWGTDSSDGDLYEDLELTEKQREKIDAIKAETDKSVRARIAEARENGDWLAIAPDIAKMRADAEKKVKAELTPEQREKYEKRAATRDPMKALGGISSLLKRLGREGEASLSSASRVESVMKDLKIANADEAEAIKFLVTGIVKRQDELEKLERSHREKTDGMLRKDDLSEKALGERLKAFRAERAKLEKGLRDAQAELLEVITVRQEGVLFRHAILR